jgi:hypothetical protein
MVSSQQQLHTPSASFQQAAQCLKPRMSATPVLPAADSPMTQGAAGRFRIEGLVVSLKRAGVIGAWRRRTASAVMWAELDRGVPARKVAGSEPPFSLAILFTSFNLR